MTETNATRSGNLRFYTSSNAFPSERMRITSGGFVGIGTTSPSYNLDVNTSVRVFNTVSGSTAEFRASGSAYAGSYNSSLRSIAGAIGILQLGNNADNYIIGGNTNAGGYLIFKVNATTETYTSGIEAMRITSGGNTEIRGGNILNIYRTDNTRALQLYVTGNESVIDSWEASSEPLMLRSNGSGGRIVFHTAGSERVRIASSGNVGINDTNPQTRFSINGANYIEMATFTATAASASSIVSNDGGYVQFSNSEARHNSNTGVFSATTNGVQILKAGIVHITVSQDIITAGSVGYIAMTIRKNGSNISENLITHTGGQWDMINGVATASVAANDVIGFHYGGGDILSFDPGTWSMYSFIWASR
jgi:hypothetical protein